MALGDITQIVPGQSYAVELLASVTAVNGAPSAGAGIDINALGAFGRIPRTFRVGIKSTAGSGTMTVTLRVWFRFGSTVGWQVAKALAAADSAPQTAVAIAETGTDILTYSEVVDCPQGADRVYLEVVGIAGTSTAVTGFAFVGRDPS